MSKVLLCVSTNGNSYETKGIMNKKTNILSYSGNDGSIYNVDFKNDIFIRKRKDSILTILFSDKCDSHIRYEFNHNFIEIPMNLVFFNKDSQYFHFEYFVEGEKIKYILNIIKFY